MYLPANKSSIASKCLKSGLVSSELFTVGDCDLWRCLSARSLKLERTHRERIMSSRSSYGGGCLTLQLSLYAFSKVATTQRSGLMRTRSSHTRGFLSIDMRTCVVNRAGRMPI